MNILFINSVYGYGSTGKIIKKLKEETEREGHSASVIFGRKSALGYKGTIAEDENCYFISSDTEQKMDILSSVLFDTHGLHSKKNTEKIIAKINEIDPDVIHLHNIHGFYLNYEMLFDYLRKTQKPVVWTLHDCWAYTGYCAYYDYNECDAWKSGCARCQYRNEYPYRILSSSKHNVEAKKKAFANINMILITPSQWLKGEVAQSFLQSYRCDVIYNDVNLKDFYYDPGNIKEQYNLLNKRVYLSCANVWTKQKGYEECLKLADKLGYNEVLVMVGLNEKQIKKLPKNIVGITHCGIDELRCWYSSCDVFFNPTLEDNYPTVNLEAAACGAPIVAYRTGGSPESAGKHGIIIDRYDTDRAIKELRKADRKNMPAAVKETRSMAREYMELYSELRKGTEK